MGSGRLETRAGESGSGGGGSGRRQRGEPAIACSPASCEIDQPSRECTPGGSHIEPAHLLRRHLCRLRRTLKLDEWWSSATTELAKKRPRKAPLRALSARPSVLLVRCPAGGETARIQCPIAFLALILHCRTVMSSFAVPDDATAQLLRLVATCGGLGQQLDIKVDGSLADVEFVAADGTKASGANTACRYIASQSPRAAELLGENTEQQAKVAGQRPQCARARPAAQVDRQRRQHWRLLHPHPAAAAAHAASAPHAACPARRSPSGSASATPRCAR